MMTASAPIACSVSAVSLRLSPLETLEPLAEKLMTSALSRLAAASNEMRVRVESSKKRLTTVRPRSVGQLLDRAARDAQQLFGGVEDADRVGAVEVAGAQEVLDHACSPVDRDGVGAVGLGQAHLDLLDQRGRQVLADEVGPDRQLAVAAVDQHGELDGLGPAEVVEGVERGADRAAGEQHVVDQHDDLAVDVVGDLGVLERAGGLEAQVVAVHRDVERAGGDLAALDLGHALGDAAGEMHSARRDAEQDETGGVAIALEDLVGDAGQRPGDVLIVKDGAGGGGARVARAASSDVTMSDLLLRLSGRPLKDVD